MDTQQTEGLAIAMPTDRGRPRFLSARLSLGACLALAFLAVLLVLMAGMRLAQRSTSETAELVSSVESRYEPLLAMSRELESALRAYDRAVAGLPRTATAAEQDEFASSGAQLLAVLGEYSRLVPEASGLEPGDLRLRIEDLHGRGIAIGDLYRQRTVEIHRSLSALDAIVDRVSRAGGSGLELGDQVFARRSLSELSHSATAMRASASALFAAPSATAAHAADVDAAAFTALLNAGAPEFGRSPGRAWLELVREDLATVRHGREHFLAIDERIASTRSSFSASAHDLELLVEERLQKPAWNALRQAAGRARLTAEKAEEHLSRVAICVLAVVLLIAGVIAYGITGPARRLLEGTRRLTQGELDARVPRGGVRELDALALAFNDMAGALDTTRKALQEQRAVLEDRVAERTAQLRHLANHDPLTDLPNRRELASYLGAAIGRARASATSCSVFYMDIDNFKTINDSLGHEFGDRVLRAVGMRLLDVAGQGGFLARLGGDEFTIVVEDVDAAAAEASAVRIMQAFQKPLRVADRELLVSLSVGIALCPDHGETTEALLRAADSALFHAKDRGRKGYSLYEPELLAAASHRFNTEQGLRRALETGDFLLYFQPEVSLIDMSTSVVEALLRWRQPDGRIATAGEFMEIAERSGLILELSDWVLRRAVETARDLRRGVWPQAKVAINVSAQQFLTGRFVESVERVLREMRMPPDCLEVELTETALQNGKLAIDALHELRRIGVSVALDDFGAGYSSLKSIDELPLTRVKLDRSLMKDVDANASAAAIAHAIVRLCRSLGLTVTTEGIERPGQLDFLASCGDVHVQGYLIARPAPVEDIAKFVVETRQRLAAVWPDASEPAAELSATGPHEAVPVTFIRPRGR